MFFKISNGYFRASLASAKKIPHTMQWRQYENGLLSIKDELQQSESKLVYNGSTKTLPKGISNIITEKPSNLRGRKFNFCKNWKKSSIAYRLTDRASKEIKTLETISTQFELEKHLKLKNQEQVKYECKNNSCYICRNPRT
jgi:hypothetical protein